MPDVLVDCFTLSDQSLDGAAAVARSVEDGYRKRPIRVLPVPMRIDEGEKEKVDAGRALARLKFDGLPKGLGGEEMAGEELTAYWGAVEIPYRPYYAYEETLATVGDESGIANSLLSAFERLTAVIWSAPQRNNTFTGRDVILDRVRDQLGGGISVVLPQPQALYGRGGVGKTQVALEYVHRFMADYDLVWWISADDALLAVAERARLLAGAAAGVILQPTPEGGMEIVAASTHQDPDGIVGTTIAPGSPVLEQLLGGEPVFIDDSATDPRMTTPVRSRFGPSMMLPLQTEGRLIGTLALPRARGDRPYTRVERLLATQFASQAALALVLAGARHSRERLAVYEDRDRIARDLHDLVVQRLFATGMMLESTLRRSRAEGAGGATESEGAGAGAKEPGDGGGAEVRATLGHAVDELQEIQRRHQNENPTLWRNALCPEPPQ